MCGLERKSRTDPKGVRPQPINPTKDTGHMLNAATQGASLHIRRQQLSLIRSDVYGEPDGRGRRGGADLALEDDGRGGANIHDNAQVPFDRLFWDPHSRRLDFSDARATKASSSGWIAIICIAKRGLTRKT